MEVDDFGTISEIITQTQAIGTANHDTAMSALPGGLSNFTYAYEGTRGRLAQDDSYTYEWDEFDRITKAISLSYKEDSAEHPTPKSVTYKYDGMGRRTAYIYEGHSTQGLENDTWPNVRLVYDGVHIIQERRFDDNTLLKAYFYEAGINRPVLMKTYQADGVTVDKEITLITDDRGSLVGCYENGSVVEKIYYNSTGLQKVYDSEGDEIKNEHGKATYRSSVPFGWTGMYKDPFTGKYHTHFRDYDPITCRWLSEDPAGYADGLNLYNAYMGVNGRDSLGLYDMTAGDFANLTGASLKESGLSPGTKINVFDDLFLSIVMMRQSSGLKVDPRFIKAAKRITNESSPFLAPQSSGATMSAGNPNARPLAKANPHLNGILTLGSNMDRNSPEASAVAQINADFIQSALGGRALSLRTMKYASLGAKGAAYTTIAVDATMVGAFGWMGGQQAYDGFQNGNLKDMSAGMLKLGLAYLNMNAMARGLKSSPVVEYSGRSAQAYTSDLSHVTGKTAQTNNRAIQSIIAEDLPSLNLTYIPEYSPFMRTGIAQKGMGTQIGKTQFSSRANLLDVIVHEEVHHRWWSKGLYNHHPKGSLLELKFYATIARYKRMRGFPYLKSHIDKYNKAR